MGTRPRSKFVMALKSRRCSKCGTKLNNQLTRCKRCHEPQGRARK